MKVPVIIEIHNTNHIKAGNGELDFDVQLWKVDGEGFAWELYLPKQTLLFSDDSVYDPITGTVGYEWKKIDFDPLEWGLKVKNDMGVISTGGFFPIRVEIHLPEKIFVVVF